MRPVAFGGVPEKEASVTRPERATRDSSSSSRSTFQRRRARLVAEGKGRMQVVEPDRQPSHSLNQWKRGIAVSFADRKEDHEPYKESAMNAAIGVHPRLSAVPFSTNECDLCVKMNRRIK